ncbi:MAG TPA: metalloregulator ArsR/SmtB family transcription factor [Anaerolineales bacterium]|nr:metalloregulator ArsR/SmtB family transcription factor [Anaerolineales bacterium]
MKSESRATSSVEFAKALADPTRQEIMTLICCRELNVGDIVDAVGVRQPTVSHHLAILRNAGLVTLRNEGKHTYYALNQGRVAVCCGNLIEVFAPQSEAADLISDTGTADV